jgi:chromosome segregation ATPase
MYQNYLYKRPVNNIMDEEYEVIPTSPIRKLEERLGKLESSSSASEVQRLIEQIIELIKSNQRIINDVVKSDSELRSELSRLPVTIENLVSKMNEFLDMLKATATEDVSEASQSAMEPVVNKINELVEQNKKTAEANQAVLANLSSIDNRLKRLYMGSAPAGTRRY